MTVGEAISYVRNRQNATNDTFWSDAEIMKLIEGRSQEILGIVGLIEAIDTSITTVASTQSYAFPTEVEFIKRIAYNGTDIQLIDFRDWDVLKLNGVTPTGTPRYYLIWNKQIILVPTPTDVATLTLYVEKRQSPITATTDTIESPTVLHFRLMDGVIADMYAKDENAALFQQYENKWQGVHIPAFYTYKQQYRRRGRNAIVKDADTLVNSDFGAR